MAFTPDEQRFMEQFTELGVASGLTRSASSIFSYLIICKPPKQTASDLQNTLSLSAGSVSTATTVLTRVGLVKTAKVRGDRRMYYEIEPEGLIRSIEQRFRTVTAAKQIAADALITMPNNQRMRDVHKTYDTFETLLADFLKRLK